ncbi:hypothetical protein [Costertonia aggregata]|uniref:Uncharacterized protein n=1 Tax=Costertonia aggregata TaxID=343403 RepID=A0A7H9APA6_9FLAO|nr:hypothetical protein [Costertonia aggregata]QLG45301.1 hypothetical protein HYG79_08055 [Costertonia aggregata]
MKAKLLHQQAMDYSFKAKQAVSENNSDYAFEMFCKAAEIESKVAKFYFDKPELEPTRSVLIRSAAFLNLKAGLIDKAQEFIFFGLLNVTDKEIKSQLNDALEISVSLKNMSPYGASNEYNYLTQLRQKSIHYILEPSHSVFGNSVSLEMLKDFSNNFLKSLKSYASSMFTRFAKDWDYSEEAAKEFEKLANPLLTGSSIGSFKFSLANDFLSREGEDDKIKQLKSNIVEKYHTNIFINPLDTESIQILKKEFSDKEINDIFRPLTRIKAKNSAYKIGYYDTDNYNKIFIPRIATEQKKKLLPIVEINKDEIGRLESSIVHRRELSSGKVSKQTIISEELKSYEFEQLIKEITPKNYSSVILNEEILLNINFDSENGFDMSFPDFDLKTIDTEYQRGLDKLSELLYLKIIQIAEKDVRDDIEQAEWDFIKKIISNPEALKR